MRYPGPAVTLALGALAGPAAAQQAIPACPSDVPCNKVATFLATVTDYRTSVSAGTRLVTVTLNFQNISDQPLRLGYVQGSGLATDDQGNRYPLTGAVRGMGEITGNSFDPKFVLRPGESSTARFEFAWRPTRGVLFGTKHDVELAVREIEPVAGNQFRFGKEHVLQYRGLAEAAAVAEAPAPVAAPAPASAPVEPAPDPCEGKQRCFAAGPFVAEVSRLTPGAPGGRHHTLQVILRVRNLSPEPIILGYKSGTSGATDEHGNRYAWGRPGTHDVSAKGIGLVTGRAADPQFVLAPGQSRNATFELVRFNIGRTALGTVWTYDVALAQLEVLPGNQVRELREYSVSFQDLRGPGAAGRAAQGLIDGLTGRRKP